MVLALKTDRCKSVCRQASCLLCGSNILSVTDSSKPYSKRIMTGTFSFIHTLSVQRQRVGFSTESSFATCTTSLLAGCSCFLHHILPRSVTGRSWFFRSLFLRWYQNRENLAREMYSPIRRHITNISLEQQLFTHCLKTSVNAFHVHNPLPYFFSGHFQRRD